MGRDRGLTDAKSELKFAKQKLKLIEQKQRSRCGHEQVTTQHQAGLARP